MTAIELAGELYRQLRKERPVHAPATLAFRTFMVQHFQQEGHKLATEIDREGRESGNEKTMKAVAKPTIPVQKKTLRRFQHPHQGMTETPGSFRGGLGKIRGTLRQSVEALPLEDDPDFPQAVEQPIISSPSVVTPEVSTAPVKGKDHAVAVDPVHVDALKKLGIDLSVEEKKQIASMAPSSVVEKFDMKLIRQWMTDNQIKFKVDGSDRQVAATLVNHLKRN